MSKLNVITILQNRTKLRIGATALDDIIQTDLDFEIDAAVLDYSQDEPKERFLEASGAALTDVGGIKFFRITDWDEDISDETEIKIFFPIDLARESILRRGHDLDWIFTERPTGAAGAKEFFVRFFNPPDDSGGNWRIK